ncbi:MAG: bifunctional UDP-3-O-[3-hydroxymyristoyl] N-acetylglucosamine deacetylase/3-hydroxyacyl-ACP dehydratase [Candidatus Omnitrophota bacterium]|nr:MAG: bifunctional UDP-3-O-[3-hydroxymyristoyl] N-acetylglucosamine deacetylase/3-hydroxyacyl-ACP dehydratase [Candidatus Omnitrophota bacterium]
MPRQKTIKKEIKVSGVGIHTGQKVELLFKPAEKNTGIKFIRVDLPGKPVIAASISNVMEKSLKSRRTSLGEGKACVHTVEHVLSALFGLGIDNIIIEVKGEEVPALDGGALGFCRILRQAQIIELNSPKVEFAPHEASYLDEDGGSLAVFPDDKFRISYTLSYPEAGLNQHLDLVVTEESFMRELAPCKTFCLENEVERLQGEGLGKGASIENTIVVGKKGIVKGKPTFSDEFTRHKVLDLIGDFCLLAPSIKAHVLAVKSGHPLNIKFLKKLSKTGSKHSAPLAATHNPGNPTPPPFDIEKIMQILPHRYPFLLVDRVLDFEEGKHIVGVKNVTINEQFFNGHFPGRPVMPGVLILEAMAQTAGILMLSRPENRGKLAYFMSMDKVKFRKTVVPGDQLILKVDVVRIKSRIIQIKAEAFVADKLVAEADLMFSLVPKE